MCIIVKKQLNKLKVTQLSKQISIQSFKEKKRKKAKAHTFNILISYLHVRARMKESKNDT
jgi:hypothetical protein